MEESTLLPAPTLELCAQLHSPSRREEWVKKLRRARYGRLLRLLPKVALSPGASTVAAAPPGAVIYPLGITSWAALATLRESKRCFFCKYADGSKVWLDPESTEQEWLQATERVQKEPAYLAELPGRCADKLWVAHYAADAAGRITLQSCKPSIVTRWVD
jgi:hypothetical protein